MASDDPVTSQFHSSLQDEIFENDINDTYDHHHHHHDHDPHHHSLSRFSVCTNSTVCGVDDDDDDDVDDGMAMYVSGLSLESLEVDSDADGEFSDGPAAGLFSDSENELPLPATPPPRRTPISVKEYASDNEGERGVLTGRGETKEKESKCRRMRKEKDTWVWDTSNSEKNTVQVITRPKGGSRSLCMDLEEVKACRDLGFELELELEMPSPLAPSLSNSALDTSSGATSPIATANWRISSPGDDPRDVKARLKMWAQAVAASASKYAT